MPALSLSAFPCVLIISAVVAIASSPSSAAEAPTSKNHCKPLVGPFGSIQTTYQTDIGTKYSNFILSGDRYRDACIGFVAGVPIEEVVSSRLLCLNSTTHKKQLGQDGCTLDSAKLSALQARLFQKCFGYLGAECMPTLPGSANKRWVNSGSIKHDRCCWNVYKRNIDSYKSNRPLIAATGCEMGHLDNLFASRECADSWKEANDNALRGRNWERVYDPNHVNSTGVIEKSRVYAIRGTRVHMSDEQYCLNGSRLLNPFTERAERFMAFERVCE